MTDTWTSRLDASRAWDAGRHPRAPAGAAGGGEFAPASSGSGTGVKGKDTRATPTSQHPVGTGEKGKRVSDLQSRLNALGAEPPLKVDGIFGPKTLAAVKAFQKAHGLKVDGLVGPKTTAALRGGKHPAQHAPAHTAVHAPAKTAPAGSSKPPGKPARPAARAMVHEKLGKPGGPGLWHDKDRQLPAYIQHIAKDLMTERAMPESEAIATAISMCKKWAAGGKDVKPDTRAKAAAAIAEWERLKASTKATRSDPMSDDHDAGTQDRKGRSAPGELMRIYPLEDIHILTRSEGDGTGRVVEAYATVFDTEAEIHDHQGHYTEVIDRTAFDQILARIMRSPGGLAAQVKVLYNHGKTIGGAEAPEFQLPLGKPLDVRPEPRGLLTRTEYDASDPFTERILSKIHAGTITAQSFVGGIIRSSPELRGPGDRYRGRGGALTTVRRMVLGLREYGPVLFPAYSGAEILGVRMSIPGALLDEDAQDVDLTADEKFDPGIEGPDTGGVPEDTTSTRYHQHALYALRSKEAREKAGLTWDD